MDVAGEDFPYVAGVARRLFNSLGSSEEARLQKICLLAPARRVPMTLRQLLDWGVVWVGATRNCLAPPRSFLDFYPGPPSRPNRFYLKPEL